MARDFATVVGCIHRDCGILLQMYVRCPVHPREDIWRLVNVLLDAAEMTERLALGIDSWGVISHQGLATMRTREGENSTGSENGNE
jgi:hypothetical protein